MKKVLMPSSLMLDIANRHDRMRVMILDCNNSISNYVLILIKYACMKL